MDKLNLTNEVGRALGSAAMRLAVAESCTGGLLGHLVTNAAGSSAYFLGGIIAYSNEVKMGLLGVRPATLEAYGAVSEPTVREMARGVRETLGAEIGVSISGVAGPGGGTVDKPVGLVFSGLAAPTGEWVRRWQFEGSRLEIKQAAADAVLRFLLDYLEDRL